MNPSRGAVLSCCTANSHCGKIGVRILLTSRNKSILPANVDDYPIEGVADPVILRKTAKSDAARSWPEYCAGCGFGNDLLPFDTLPEAPGEGADWGTRAFGECEHIHAIVIDRRRVVLAQQSRWTGRCPWSGQFSE